MYFNTPAAWCTTKVTASITRPRAYWFCTRSPWSHQPHWSLGCWKLDSCPIVAFSAWAVSCLLFDPDSFRYPTLETKKDRLPSLRKVAFYFSASLCYLVGFLITFMIYRMIIEVETTGGNIRLLGASTLSGLQDFSRLAHRVVWVYEK